MQGRSCRGLQGRFIRPLMESPETYQVSRPLTSRAGYFNLPYLKDLVDRVEARELPLEEALEDGGKPPKSPAGQGQKCL
jgi:hypothetical protein